MSFDAMGGSTGRILKRLQDRGPPRQKNSRMLAVTFPIFSAHSVGVISIWPAEVVGKPSKQGARMFR